MSLNDASVRVAMVVLGVAVAAACCAKAGSKNCKVNAADVLFPDLADSGTDADASASDGGKASGVNAAADAGGPGVAASAGGSGGLGASAGAGGGGGLGVSAGAGGGGGLGVSAGAGGSSGTAVF